MRESVSKMPRLILASLPIVIVLAATAILHSAAATDKTAGIYSEAVEAHWKWDLDKAINLYTRVLKVHPNDARAYFGRGAAYRSLEKTDEALADFNEAASRAPNMAEALFGRGSLYLHKGMYDKAVEDMNKVLKVDPK